MAKRKQIEKSFFRLQLISSLGFGLLLAIALSIYFLFSHWNTYQKQFEFYKKSYINNQIAALHDAVNQEFSYINELIENGEFTNQQQQILKRLQNIRLGPEKTGYFFVLKVNNIKGGDNFAHHLLLPINPDEVGLPMDSDIKDKQGNAYREIYLQQLRDNGIAELTYWYKKPGENTENPKISVLRWIDSIDWIIGAGIYTEELSKTVQHQKQALQNNFYRDMINSSFMTLLILLVASLAQLFLQKKIRQLFHTLKLELNQSQTELEALNNSLAQQVEDKTIELENRYNRDTITNLFNRKKLLDDLQAFQQDPKTPPTSFILINIDNFKELNELFGDPTGDLILKVISVKLNELCGFAKNIYRVGGDEFLIWLQQTESGLEKKLACLHHELRANANISALKNIYFNLTLSAVGVSKTPISELEMSMRIAKRKSLNWLVYQASHNQRSHYLENLNITEMIRTAIEQDRVIPVFQPIFNLQSGEIEKYECLIRIENDGKLISPAEFLHIAERSKLYPQLMEAMLKKSFAQFKDSNYEFSINLSYHDIEGNEIPKILAKLLTPEIGRRVIFEILETEGINNYELVSKFIEKLKSYGCKIAIDDYGSGYSNLEYLLKLQIDILKIDGSLIENLPDKNSTAIVKSIVLFAEQLGIDTVAEFVSSEKLYHQVKGLGVNYAQGFYLGKPQQTIDSR